MKFKCAVITLLAATIEIASCYSIGSAWEGYGFESNEALDHSKIAPDEYIKGFFGNTGNRVFIEYPPKERSVIHSTDNYLKPPISTYHRSSHDNFDIDQRADFGNYDLFRWQVEGRDYKPHVYYRHSLPKSRTNIPGFAQRVVFEDELPFRRFKHF